MKPPGTDRPRRRRGSARLRLMVLLTLALLPVGVIAVVQARGMAEQARAMSQRALLGETIRAAAAQREVIRTAQGQARALVPLLRQVADDPGACARLMAQVVEVVDLVGFAGFVAPDGRLVCTSAPGGAAPPGAPALADLVARREARVATGDLPDLIAAAPGVMVLQPVLGHRPDAAPRAAALPGPVVDFGTVVLSLPRASLLGADLIPGLGEAPVQLTTFDRAGAVLWESPVAPGAAVAPPEEARARMLPADTALAAHADSPAHGFTARSGAGEMRAYAVVPVIEGELVTLGAWPPGTPFSAAPERQITLSMALPLAMWALSLAVAFVAVNRLVVAPLGALRGRMQAFTAGARTLPPTRLDRAPDELAALGESFDAMVARIVSDERRLARAVQEKEVLLREVHHRVKNNLQLIASILNMQIRQHRAPESRAVLRRVQDRVMSLAIVHQHLYETPSLAAMKVDSLLAEIVNRRIAEAGPLMAGVRVETRFAPVRLYPDQAVPLALLLGEAVTNVLYHVGRPEDGGAPWVSIVLAGPEADGAVTLSVSNSGGAALRSDQADHRAGLGTRLIAAFATQLAGDLTRQEGDGAGRPWRLSLRFRPMTDLPATDPAATDPAVTDPAAPDPAAPAAEVTRDGVLAPPAPAP